MFFPYLRGRQNELLAIRRTAAQIAASGKITPILEPVSANLAGLARSARQALYENAPLAIITNPIVGDLAGTTDVLGAQIMETLLSDFPSALKPAFIIQPSTTAPQVNSFLTKYKRDVCLVHRSASSHGANIATVVGKHKHAISHIFGSNTAHTYRQLFGRHALLQDRFNRQTTNAKYAPNNNEFFSDAHLTYLSNNHIGFGDHSMVGEHYSDSGGPAYAVALHLHYQHDDGTVWIRHFVSDSNQTTADTAGKFAEAVAKLARFVQQRPAAGNSDACREYLDHHRAGHFPGLGAAKQLSLRHHIELMAQIL